MAGRVVAGSLGVLVLLLVGIACTDADEPPTPDQESSGSTQPGPDAATDDEPGRVTLVAMPEGFSAATAPAPESFIVEAREPGGCVLATRVTSEPTDYDSPGTGRERSEAELVATVTALDGSEPVIVETWFPASGETDLDGNPIWVVNVVQADWTAADGTASRLALRASVVPDFSEGADLDTGAVLLTCPSEEAIDGAWSAVQPQVRLGVWVAGPEQPGQWSDD